MSQFQWFEKLSFSDDQLVTRDMHSDMLWHALLMSIKEQYMLYGWATKVRDKNKRRELRTRCLLISTVCAELLGELRLVGAIDAHQEKSRNFHDLLKFMETDFQKMYPGPRYSGE